MDFLIVTGISGGGKSSIMSVLEDIGFYCIDNMPALLIPKFAGMCMQSDGKITRVALAVDIRGGDDFSELFLQLDELLQMGIQYQIVFVTASDETIIKRYKETRRRHPLEEKQLGATMQQAIDIERNLLQELYNKADVLIDTTSLTLTQLKDYVIRLFQDHEKTKLIIQVISFGYKYGLPQESDLVFNVQCFPNPHYVDDLREKTGLDAEVSKYVFQSESARELLDKIIDLVAFMLPLYKQEGKSKVVIAVGCTGGHHRSVAFVAEISRILKEKGFFSVEIHKDITK